MSDENKPAEPERSRRLGRMDIVSSIVDSDEIGWEIMRQLAFMPWHAIYNASREVVEMLGSSPSFRELDPEEPAPYYEVRVNHIDNEDGTKSLQVFAVELAQMPQSGDTLELDEDTAVVGGEQ